jgi:hypothetical protein
MKSVVLLGLPLLASAAVLDTRQSAAGFISRTKSPYPPRLHASAERYLSRFGRKLFHFIYNFFLTNFVCSICSKGSHYCL